MVLGFDACPPSELDLLQWAGDARRREPFKRLEATAREETALRLREFLGDLVSLVFAAIETGSADDLLAVAMLCESLDDNGATRVAVKAQVAARLEALFGGLTLSTPRSSNWPMPRMSGSTAQRNRPDSSKSPGSNLWLPN
ncbi:MAG: hypothetical protein MZV65_36885 [Chromatiales bacterium]|nr:hypothetical protein [Chromatiales bacterium]